MSHEYGKNRISKIPNDTCLEILSHKSVLEHFIIPYEPKVKGCDL